MGNIVLTSMLSVFAIVCLMIALAVGFVTFMIGVMFKKDIKRDERNIKTIVTLGKFITFLVVIATILEVVAVYIK